MFCYQSHLQDRILPEVSRVAPEEVRLFSIIHIMRHFHPRPVSASLVLQGWWYHGSALPIRDTAMIRPLERVGRDRRKALLAVPRTAILRIAQTGHDGRQTVEEAYEVADAIARGDSVALKGRTG